MEPTNSPTKIINSNRVQISGDSDSLSTNLLNNIIDIQDELLKSQEYVSIAFSGGSMIDILNEGI